MKKGIVFLLCVLMLAGCAPQKQHNSVTWLNLFDTVTTLQQVGESREVFDANAEKIYDQLLSYHQLFDIYKEYDGQNNLKTVNDWAGKAPVKVDASVIALLKEGIRYYQLTDGRVNIAMGSVLSLWHGAREKAVLPTVEALLEAAQHTDISKIHIDEEKGTVYLADEQMRLDVGAIAKGWAAQKVAEKAPEGYLISVGGNICATGQKTQEGAPWVVGIQDPNGGEQYLHTLSLFRGSVVTSGDYQRYVTVDGKKYHHIIDPDTLQPSLYWSSVTVVCGDSALADALSTALFVLPLEQGAALLKKTGAEAMWVEADGKCHYSDGFQQHMHAREEK